MLAVLALASSTAALPLPAASAASPDKMAGSCFFEAEQSALTADQNVGVIGDHSVTTDSTGAPTGATVTCWLAVNGAEVEGTRFDYSGFGVQAGIHQISFPLAPDDSLGLCQTVTYADGTVDDWGCATLDATTIPPQAIIDLINDLLTVCDGWGCGGCGDYVSACVEPVLCAESAEHAGDYGPVVVRPDGDIYVLDPLGLGLNPFLDCPPYAVV
ncbi:MAG: hypothetical protein QOG34_2377 [Frankiaceae bacterium]|nr:hypothetical protein [Frankiaceae bacterium]